LNQPLPAARKAARKGTSNRLVARSTFSPIDPSAGFVADFP
jgi:hypothetical protein